MRLILRRNTQQRNDRWITEPLTNCRSNLVSQAIQAQRHGLIKNEMRCDEPSLERLERGTDTSMVRILTIGIAKPRAGIDKGPLPLGYCGVVYRKVSWSCPVAWASAPIPSIVARRCRAVCRCAARWLGDDRWSGAGTWLEDITCEVVALSHWTCVDTVMSASSVSRATTPVMAPTP